MQCEWVRAAKRADNDVSGSRLEMKEAISASHEVGQIWLLVRGVRLTRTCTVLLYGLAVDADEFLYPEFGHTQILVAVRLSDCHLYHVAFNAAAVQSCGRKLEPVLTAVVRHIDG